MPRLENVPRFSGQQFPEAPGWFLRFIEEQNRFNQNIAAILQGGITVQNENSETIELQMQDGVALAFDTPSIRGVPEEVLIQFSEDAVTSFQWKHVAEKQVEATVTFTGSPTEPKLVRFRVRGSA